MSLTEQQREKLRQKYGQNSSTGGQDVSSRLQRLNDIAKSKQQVSQPEKAPTTAGGVVGGVARGIGKGLLSTAVQAPGLIERGFRGIAKTILPKSLERRAGFDKPLEQTAGEKLVPEELRTPEGTAEKVGFGIEQIGELFIPIPGLRAVKGVNLARGASKANKLLNLGKFVTIESAELAAKIALQTGGDAEEVKKAGVSGAVGAGFGKLILEPVFSKLAPSLARYLEKTNLRLTPAQKQKINQKSSDVIEYLTNKKIVGTPEARFNKVNKIYNETEDVLQKFLSKSDDTVNKAKYLDEIDTIKTKYKNDRDLPSIIKQVDSAKDSISLNFKDVDEIPIKALNEFKRSTYKGAYNKAGDKILDTVEHDIGDISRLNIERATVGQTINGKSIGEFNKEYGTIIESLKLLRVAQSRKQIGLVGKILAMSVGGSIGTAAGGGIGTAAGVAVSNPIANAIAGTATRSIIESGLVNISKIPEEKIMQAIVRAITVLTRE